MKHYGWYYRLAGNIWKGNPQLKKQDKLFVYIYFNISYENGNAGAEKVFSFKLETSDIMCFSVLSWALCWEILVFLKFFLLCEERYPIKGTLAWDSIRLRFFIIWFAEDRNKEFLKCLFFCVSFSHSELAYCILCKIWVCVLYLCRDNAEWDSTNTETKRIDQNFQYIGKLGEKLKFQI